MKFLVWVTVMWVAAGVFGWIVPPLWRIRRAQQRAAQLHWFELRPRAGRELTIERMGPAMGSALGGLRQTGRFRMRGGVGVRLIDGGQFRSLVGLWGWDMDPGGAAKVAQALATAIGGSADPLDNPPVLPEGAVALAMLERHDPFDFNDSTDPGAVTEYLAGAMNSIPGEAALVFTFETITNWESDHKRQWLTVNQRAREGNVGSVGTLSQHTSKQASTNVVRCRAVAVGPTQSDVDALVTGFGPQLVGFAQRLRSKRMNDWRRARALVIGLAALTGLWALVSIPVAMILAVAAAGCAMASLSGQINMTFREVTENLKRGLLIAHIPRRDNPRKTLQGIMSSTFRDKDSADATSLTAGARAANPHPSELFLMEPLQLASMLGFPSEGHAAVEASTAIERPASSAVKHLSGLRLGCDSVGDTIWLAEEDLFQNLVAFGEPGSGKSTLIQGIWWSSLLRREEAAITGLPTGAHIAIETKGDGATRYIENANRANANNIGLMVAAGTGPRLDLVLWDHPKRAAELLLEACRYVFDDSDIGERAAGVLRASLRCAVACPPDIAQALGWGHGRPNVMRVAYWLLGGDPSQNRPQQVRDLFSEHTSRNMPAVEEPAMVGEGMAGAFNTAPGPGADGRLAATEAGRAWQDFCRYLPPFMKKTESDVIVESSKNKIEALLVAENMFEPDPTRPSFTFHQVLAGQWAVVLNFGPPGAGASGYTRLLAQRLGGMALYCLWDAIRTTCVNWQAQGKAVHIFNDELRDLVGVGNTASRDVIGEIVDQGRSYGVRMFLATQRPTQLLAAPKEAVLGFGGRVYFRQDEIETAEAVSRDLDEAYTPKEIRALANFTGVCRLRVNGVAQPAFTIKPVNDPHLSPETHTVAHLDPHHHQ